MDNYLWALLNNKWCLGHIYESILLAIILLTAQDGRKTTILHRMDDPYPDYEIRNLQI